MGTSQTGMAGVRMAVWDVLHHLLWGILLISRGPPENTDMLLCLVVVQHPGQA